MPSATLAKHNGGPHEQQDTVRPGERPRPPASPTPTPPRAALDASATHQRGGPVTPPGLRVYVRGSGELESLLPRAVEMKRELAALAVPRSPGPGVRRWPGRRGTRALAVAGARESGGVCLRPGPRHSAVNCAVPDLGRHPLLVSLRDQDGRSHTCLMTLSPGRAPSSGQENPRECPWSRLSRKCSTREALTAGRRGPRLGDTAQPP